MNTGIYISGLAHGLLIVWLLAADQFARPQEEPLEVTEVALIDAETFAALTAPAAAPETLADVPVPPTPAPISAPEAPTQEAPVEAVPPRPDPPAAATSGAVPPALRPVARPEPPQIEAAPQPLQPPDDTPGEDLDLATPAPAPRVAPVPNLRPDPADAPDDVPTVATRPSPTADRALPSQERAAAPPRATDRIITEADEADETVTTSLRPRPRPNRPAPQPAQRHPPSLRQEAGEATPLRARGPLPPHGDDRSRGAAGGVPRE